MHAASWIVAAFVHFVAERHWRDNDDVTLPWESSQAQLMHGDWCYVSARVLIHNYAKLNPDLRPISLLDKLYIASCYF